MKPIRTTIIVTVFWTIVVGGIYPLLMTGIGAVLFPQKIQGSLVVKGGKVVGSSLIAQDFQSDIYFHPRPSAVKYDPSSSGASNWGWTSSDLKKAYDQRKGDWQKAYGAASRPWTCCSLREAAWILTSARRQRKPRRRGLQQRGI